MFFAPVVRTRATVPSHRSFDRSFELRTKRVGGGCSL